MTHRCRLFLCLILSSSLLLSLVGCSDEGRSQYRQGEAAFNAGKYTEAVGCFAAAEGYSDSDQYLQKIYQKALTFYEEGNYPVAADIFTALAACQVADSQTYALVAGGYACMEALDSVGARQLLETADPAHPETAGLREALDTLCFPHTVLIRPEYIVREIRSGKITPEVTNVSQDPNQDEIVYTMTARYTDLAYAQYREYCMETFADSFRDESNSYFSFQLGDGTCYVCNFHSVYGGLAIRIPRY